MRGTSARMATTFDSKDWSTFQKEALDYHSTGRRGKIEVVPTKPVATARDLSLAYSPGVAEPCLAIASDKDLSYKYTIRGNLVGVISNGTAVLGLGDIGAWAAKPVMEGKGVLFKKFADIDVFDLEVNVTDIEAFCTVVKSLEPTFGGINLEDVKSPECFVIERRLRATMGIPVFHDDQHGTAIITGAARARRRWLAPSSTWRSACRARTSTCATSTGSSTKGATRTWTSGRAPSRRARRRARSPRR